MMQKMIKISLRLWGTFGWPLILNSGTIVCEASQIKIVCTAALSQVQYGLRKQEYINAIQIIKKYGYIPFIVESCQSVSTFLDDFSDYVWYSKTNDIRLRNKGVNEVKSLLSFFDRYSFDADDIIVKVTGRYLLLDDSFFRFIEQHMDGDAFVKYMGDQVFTGCFAMKYKYFVDFLRHLDLVKMEKEMINLEKEVAAYLSNCANIVIYKLDSLNVAARIANNDYIDYI
jgi:hypothetical protein